MFEWSLRGSRMGKSLPSASRKQLGWRVVGAGQDIYTQYKLLFNEAGKLGLSEGGTVGTSSDGSSGGRCRGESVTLAIR